MKSAAIMLVIAAVLIFVGTISKNWFSGGGAARDVHIGPLGIEACMGSVCVDVPSRGIDGDISAIMVIAMLSGFASAAAAGLFGVMALTGKADRIPVPPRLAQVAFGLAAFSMTFFAIRMLSEKAELSWAGFPAIIGVVLAGVGIKRLTPYLTARPALPPGQPMQQPPYGQPYGNQSQPMQPYANQSQPMQPQPQYGSQPYANQSQPMQPQPQYGSQPHAQAGYAPTTPQAQHGSQPHPQAGFAPPAMPPPQQAPVHNCPRCGTQLHFVAQYQRWFCPREQQYV